MASTDLDQRDASSARPATFIETQQSPEFQELRSRLRRFVFPMAAFFLIWYSSYVLLGAFAHDFMATKVVGNINVALVFGLLQFVTTFALAYLYSQYSTRQLDPLARKLTADFEKGDKL